MTTKAAERLEKLMEEYRQFNIEWNKTHSLKHKGMKNLKAMKKWEVKTGKNRGLYIAVENRIKAEPFFPQWGMLSDISSYDIKKRHSLPQTCIVLTHSIWARYVMRKNWDAVVVV